jgi:D-amino-acid dehydrogenase
MLDGLSSFGPEVLPIIGTARCNKRIAYAFGRGRYSLSQAAVTSRLVAELVDDRPSFLVLTAFSTNVDDGLPLRL